MKKAFGIATLTFWILGLLIGLGFGVAGEVNANNKLPMENLRLLTEIQALTSEIDSLLESVKNERVRGSQYLKVLDLQHKTFFESATPPNVKSLGPSPHEE